MEAIVQKLMTKNSQETSCSTTTINLASWLCSSKFSLTTDAGNQDQKDSSKFSAELSQVVEPTLFLFHTPHHKFGVVYIPQKNVTKIIVVPEDTSVTSLPWLLQPIVTADTIASSGISTVVNSNPTVAIVLHSNNDEFHCDRYGVDAAKKFTLSKYMSDADHHITFTYERLVEFASHMSSAINSTDSCKDFFGEHFNIRLKKDLRKYYWYSSLPVVNTA